MSDERTEPATPTKLRDARRRGEVWKSRDLSTALTLLAAAAVLGWTGGQILDAHVAMLQLAIDAAAGRVAASPAGVLEASVTLG
ncbi:MAG: EscU/YscU/HrcU family type III secretion system export apparatus switch protein, partial [Myxococcota bacterium]|nr:EscU/YscU/HrcU family type III secretion system export apparatus switch protein [Myxococcota bacterium]